MYHDQICWVKIFKWSVTTFEKIEYEMKKILRKCVSKDLNWNSRIWIYVNFLIWLLKEDLQEPWAPLERKKFKKTFESNQRKL